MSTERRKSIFITGGAGGMGQATARLFAEKGWFAGVFDVDEERLAKLQSELGAENCISMRLDVTNEAEFREAIAAFGARTGGKMDIMFNNAGIAPGSWFEEMPIEMVRKLLDINVMGVVIGTRLALPLLKETEGSLLLSTSSSAATFAQPMRAMYSATKYAVKGLTEALGLEFERFGIRTADLLPGCIDTPMLRNALGQRDGVEVVDDPGGLLPKEGPFRLMPATAIAEAAWSAYHSTARAHWYVPEDVEDIDRLKATDFAAARQQIKQMFGTGD